jgi:hypothetical protein
MPWKTSTVPLVTAACAGQANAAVATSAAAVEIAARVRLRATRAPSWVLLDT